MLFQTGVKVRNQLIQFLILFAIFLSPVFLLSTESPKKKVALLFLTRNGLHYPLFWKTVCLQHSDKFNLYIYSDGGLADAFFESARIKQLIPTKWDYHIKTWQLLVKEAFQNPDNYKFVYLSESCVPIIPLEKIYEVLTQNDLSYMAFAGPWWPGDNSREVVELPIEHRWGNQEWVILNRKHAEMVANDEEVIETVSKYWIDSESYPSTLFSVKGCLHEFYCRATTYVNWSFPEGGGAHPYHFRSDSPFNREMLFKAQEKGYFFARKFVPPYPEEMIWRVIYHLFDE